VLFDPFPETLGDPLRRAVAERYRCDEQTLVEALIEQARLPAETCRRIEARATALVEEVRRRRLGASGLDAFLHEYDLSNQEGVVLMCLAEALLRIPDAETADRLIRDKLAGADWERHVGHSDSVFVNASTWALMLTGRIVSLRPFAGQSLRSVLGSLVRRLGEPVIRQSITQAMRILGRQFVMGRTIEEALERARADERRGYRHSFDMLGEAARTARDAERYLEAYRHAIEAIGAARGERDVIEAPGVSVKLSALHPRYEPGQRERVLAELVPRLADLARRAAAAGIGLAVDAEEAERLELSFDVIEAVLADPALAGWEGFGVALQAYQKRAPAAVDYLADLARRSGHRLMLRLVKGAYWDAEIKRAQERGLDGYPVFTRKAATDCCYLACVRRILAHGERFYPQFATHNAHTVAAVIELMGERDYEFQRLHGMGEALYDPLLAEGGRACRVYAPVGVHEDLLAYLVRRLLENGANTSFVNRIVDDDAPIEAIVADPVRTIERLEPKPHPRIPLPADLYGAERRAARGIDLSDLLALEPLAAAMEAAVARPWSAAPLVAGRRLAGRERPVTDPADRRRVVGRVAEAGREACAAALAAATAAAPGWDAAGGEARAACLERAAELYEAHCAELMALAVREAGKTVADALAEVREAVDFCRYYAARARAEFAAPEPLPGPTGEDNRLALHGRGAFVCISPWNFPLAIFTGQVTAALAAGNAVLAKPAEQTPLIAARAVELLHEAGVPGEVLHLLPGDGPEVGAALVADPRIAGVAFTGSTETARAIARTLAARDGPIVPLIAETGGQNAMIVDSSALPEQVVADAVTSAFQSAGQRCSALRVLYLQSEVAERIIEMLAGAIAELRVGDPGRLGTDCGPLIDEQARALLERHRGRMDAGARLIARAALAPECAHGTFFAPCAYQIEGIEVLEGEVFGPVLHVVRYRAAELDAIIEAINATGYGLTAGIHSRIDATVRHIHARLRVGNCYVNRNQIGAVVGVQPFGGEGLSGTGPKAGGPRYLHRFATERTLTVNTTAQGGNADLMSLGDE